VNPEISITLPWFALSVRPRRERFAATLLRNKGYTEYLPLIRRSKLQSSQKRTAESALFPGYLFCRLDPGNRLPVLTTPWVNSIVGVGNVPIPIPEEEITSVRTLVESGIAAEPWPFLHAGQRVRIDSGTLSGVDGILLSFKKQQRLVVSISLLQRSVAVEIDRDWVSPLSGWFTVREPLSMAAAAGAFGKR
jgi:transcription antitermination factor NusG